MTDTYITENDIFKKSYYYWLRKIRREVCEQEGLPEATSPSEISFVEIVLNALVHRDYSIHTEGMPIQLIMYEDRMEIRNPGGIYGRIKIDQLGKVQPDTRNPVIASELEVLKVTENRYSGIPTIRRMMQEYDLQQPEF